MKKGYSGSEEMWLASLVGPKGDKGDKGDRGEKGDKGDAGATILSGSGVPQASEGKDNDYYLDTATCDLYRKSEGAWSTVANLRGEKGDQGAKGDTGIQGEKGDTGDKGVGVSDIEIEYTGRVTITLTDGSTYTLDVSASCLHETYTTTVTAPTCDKKGYTTYSCTSCGYKYIDDYTAPTGHHFHDRICVFCNAEEPFGSIEPDTTWFTTGSYTIRNAKELAGLAYLVNTGSYNFSGVTVKLGADIDLNNAEWTPIGTAEYPFAGTFDGQGLTITNLKINNSELKDNIGLFGYVTGTLQDFNVANANINVELVGENIGIACGYSSGVMSGITVSGYLTAPKATYVGGICGYNAKTGSASFTLLVNKANVTGKTYVGGIMGAMNNVVSSSTYTVNISESGNSGEIVASGDYAGGLLGYMYIKNTDSWNSNKLCMTDLNNTGSVTTTEAYAGGVLGYAYSASTDAYIQNSANSGAVTGTTNFGSIFGYSSGITIKED